ncbi:DEAD/DEAH box helicase [Flavobacterium difficile]|uniref:DEAD/DEAH box helicase n=1 Tax=Flavobacterium difficile TaxID=2709659 RepID=A0ABX0I545_9FLAO|nr:DEAD/DEAH box helicase [Flavobacterium difficile]NHM02257.1 DEAD/DEAH box helicase [Flavobacterium difficile]
MDYFFILDFSYHQELKAYLPSLYINHSEEFRYIEKKATPEVLQHFGLELKQTSKESSRIFEIVTLLQPEKLLERFNKKVKKGFFLEDKSLAAFYFQYLDDRIYELLILAKAQHIQLTLNLYQEKDFTSKKISYSEKTFDVSLYFNKKEDGLSYKLYLQYENETIVPCEVEIHLLTNTTSWFVLNAELVLLKNINTNKLKPFLHKTTVEVPQRILASYFNTFIKDIVQKVAIQTDGFEVKHQNTLTSCTIKTAIDIFKDQPYLYLEFGYRDKVFSSEEKKQKQVSIDFENNEILVTLTTRNTTEEAKKIAQLEEFNLISSNKERWLSKTATTSLYHYLENHKIALENLQFKVADFYIGQKKINIATTTIHTEIAEQKDWFDVRMIVTIGTFTIPFAQFVPYIKNKRKIFELPDATVFIIPNEWFSKYNSLVNHLSIQENATLLPKTKIALLENVDYIVQKQKHLPLASTIKATLRPYQEKGVNWLIELYQNGYGACLADDMGLGKTIQVLSYLATIQENNLLEADKNEEIITDLFTTTEPNKTKLKALIVAPKSLLFNWYQESKKFTPFFHCITYFGTSRKTILNRLKNYDLVFTTYGTLNKDVKELCKINFNFIIVDESQNIKNKDSITYKNLESITAQQKIVLSGTPIENSLSDVWSQMQLINKDILGNYSYFKKNYLDPIEKKQDENTLIELKKILSPFILRRTKEEVLSELPEKSEQIIYCEMSTDQAKEYEKEKSKARNSLLSIDKNKPDHIQILKSLLRLRQWSNHPKLIDENSTIVSGKFEAITTKIKNLVTNQKKVLIFSSFVKHIAIYENWCLENKIKFQTLTGKTQKEAREQLVYTFQNKEEPYVFFISLKAGETGLNLTQASYVLFLDPWWNPYKENQALSRAHRMGQKEKVTVLRYITKDTIEEKIITLQEKKKIVGNSIFDIDVEITNEIFNNIEILIQ